LENQVFKSSVLVDFDISSLDTARISLRMVGNQSMWRIGGDSKPQNFNLDVLAACGPRYFYLDCRLLIT
jgi:hypothetical protein